MNYLEWAFALSIAALTLLVWSTLRRKKRKLNHVEKDASGLWKYHKETTFTRRPPWGKTCAKKGEKSEPDSDEPVKGGNADKPKSVAALRFEGDLKARGTLSLSRAVDEVCINSDSFSEIVVIINSPGGAVPHYGHAYSQIERLRQTNLPLTVCIDVVAASGGYLMSLPAHKIVAAPFAMVGSVGVVAFVPNLRRLLENWHIDPRTFTAGKFKRTVSFTDNATPEETSRFQQQLDSIHQLFLATLKKHRPQANVNEIESGDHWTALESVEKKLNLVDEISSSSQYLLEKNRLSEIITISEKQSFFDQGLGKFWSSLLNAVEMKLKHQYTTGLF